MTEQEACSTLQLYREVERTLTGTACAGSMVAWAGKLGTPRRTVVPHSHLPFLWQCARVQEERPYLMSPRHGYPQDVISLDL